ncbi:MAG: hypothetical protein J0H39_19755 [Alphaproteobacteria bacterium]|jgi:hypothetical protein|uniref:AAA family ATPase n=1 Tax=Microcystis aeruginosa Ma_OC_H_19870700_S124 TaxID=2486262 RepID=A0A552A846_MICAE|nr:hypothetical protein [Alphaproteobacteria bacterium]TRT81634.1 MAG: hypothetical protein EWV63_21650 [Microcystis aeruginosa Ma_OC_H_19870700_S124]
MDVDEDIPIDDLPDNRLWLLVYPGHMSQSQKRRISRFLEASAGSILTRNSDREILNLKKHELLALAVRSLRAGLDVSVVGSFISLASEAGSLIADVALAQFAYVAIRRSSGRSYSMADRKSLRRVLRRLVLEIDGDPILEAFDQYHAEFVSSSEAIRISDVWGQISSSESVRAAYRVIAPNLKSTAHIEGGGKEFEVLKTPLPLWRSSISSSILTTVLSTEFPHFTEVASDIARFICGDESDSLRSLLVVGPPGIGKDSVLRRAAQLVGRPFGEYDLAGSSDNRILKGTSKGWSSASPSFPAGICAQNLYANPLLILNELDCAGGNRRNGNVHEALLGLCEPTTRANWFDDGLGVPLDLGALAIAFTANGTSGTPGALLSRLRILHVEKPRAEHVRDILQQARRRVAAERQVDIDDLAEPSAQVIRNLEAAARKGRFHLRLADRVVRALSELQPAKPMH